MTKEFVPLLIGDEVEATSGSYAGRRGRVSSIEPDCVNVYFGQRHEASPGGSLSITEADHYSPKNLHFRGQPASRVLVRSKHIAPPPREAGLEVSALGNIWDDTARLVYADWLDEHEDPHGAYLRVQVALGRAVRAREPFEELADRERRLRALLNPEWVSRFRRLTTEPPPFDVGALDPAYAAFARTAVRLHPRPGDVPDLSASKLGGLFLWPEDEPWPTAAGVTVAPTGASWEPEPFPDDWSSVFLVPVVQLNWRDAPNLAFPPGTDLMQVFWCPYVTGEHAPEPAVFWRDSASVNRPHRDPPKLPKDRRSYIPPPCRLYPEPVTEYPVDDRYPNDALRKAAQEWAKTWPPGTRYDYWWNRCTGWKVGGYPWVNQDDCVRVELTGRGEKPMEYLLQVSERELAHTNWRWCPVEDRNLCFTGAGWQVQQLAGGVTVTGRGNYHLLIDRAEEPWVVKAFCDWVG
jgi:uncharacterized protein (TIGR02996 family)